MDKEKLIEELKQAKKITHVGKLLGFSYYNAWVKKKILAQCNEWGLDILEIIKENNTKYCPNCNKVINKKGNKFCDSSCAATYNNKKRGKRSEETKQKIAKSVQKYHLDIEDGHDRILKDDKIVYQHTCIICDKIFTSRRKDISYCSNKCILSDKNVRQKLRDKMNEKVANGTHKGWQSRNIKSYAELFWIDVLNNNNIKFTEELKVGKYFIDFYIEQNNKKIALEIDGKQHLLPERLASDKLKDQFLESENYIVYRIPWNSVNDEEGKKEMKDKINKFLEFLNSI